MFFFTPPYIKQGRQFLKDARKLLSYKRDLVDDETSAAVEREIGHLDVALRMDDRRGIESQMQRLDEVCAKLTKPLPDAAWRENVEVFLVAIVIALAVRTYFLQPFTIPTGSMQPTLNGIIGVRTTKPPPNPITRAFDMAVLGRTYVDLVAKADEALASDPVEIKRYLIFTFTRLTTTAGNVYLLHAPVSTVKDLLSQTSLTFKAGEPILRGYYDTGDHVFADKFSFNFRKPRRSEVFIFSTAGIPEIARGGGPSQYYIKRLSGLPGDTLRIAAPDLYINGEKAQSAAFRRVMAGTLQNPVDGYRGYSNMLRFPLLTTPEDTYTLDPGNYFALGDNSYNSSDSRNWGPVPQRNIMGRGLFVYWPFGPHWGWIR